MGTVREILLFNTVLLLSDERVVSLPNSKIQENGVGNVFDGGGVGESTRAAAARAEVLIHTGATPAVGSTELDANTAAASGTA